MRAVVVGAGIAGLACGLRLARAGVETHVLEGEPRAGGKIRTEEVGGLSVEHGPQTCFAGPALRRLAGEVGVELCPRPRGERARFLVRGGRLISPLQAVSWRGLLGALLGALRRDRPVREGESVAAYARRRFGAEAARRLFDPLVSGVFAGDPTRLEFASAFGRLLPPPRRADPGRPRTHGPRGASVSVRGGMEALPAAIARALGPALHTASPVRLLQRDGRGWLAWTDGGEIRCDRLVLAVPAFVAAALLRPIDAALADDLAAIRYEGVTAVALGYAAADFPAGPPRGFGFLAASEERLPILGCLYCAAPEGRVHLRAMLRGTPADAEATARGAVERILGARAAPAVVRAIRHERGIPQYEVGHAARLRRIAARAAALPGLRLAGNAYRAISVGDVIADAEVVADATAASR